MKAFPLEVPATASNFDEAAYLAANLDVADAVRRTRKTASQADLPAARRHANVHGAFALAVDATGIENRTIVLVDDVSTTGATLNACAAPLIAAGAREVRALTAAQARLRSAA